MPLRSSEDVVCRFNERFILSLASNKKCLVIDDQLNVLPVSSHARHLAPVPPRPAAEEQAAAAYTLNAPPTLINRDAELPGPPRGRARDDTASPRA